MAVLKVSPDRLEALAEELSKIIDSSKALDKQLQETLEYLNIAWCGSEFNDLILRLDAMQHFEEEKYVLIETLIEYITKASHVYSQIEDEVIAPFLNLDTEVIE